MAPEPVVGREPVPNGLVVVEPVVELVHLFEVSGGPSP
jgi:hypothetical protein